MRLSHALRRRGFSLVEVVLAIGVVSFAILTTVGLLSVGNDTNKRARDEGFAAQIANNEFQRLRSLSSVDPMWDTSPPTYTTRYYDSNLTDLGPTLTATAVYQLQIIIAVPVVPPGAPLPADLILNAEVHYPANAPLVNQNVFRFTTLMNIPKGGGQTRSHWLSCLSQ